MILSCRESTTYAPAIFAPMLINVNVKRNPNPYCNPNPNPNLNLNPFPIPVPKAQSLPSLQLFVVGDIIAGEIVTRANEAPRSTPGYRVVWCHLVSAS